MNQTYKPSGKVSILFLPVMFVMLIFTAVGAAVCMVCIHTSPSTLCDLALYIIITEVLVKFGPVWCIKFGKVRNQIVSVISGIGITIWYWYLLFVFYLAVPGVLVKDSFQLNKDFPQQLYQIFRNPKKLWDTIPLLIKEGIDITSKGGKTYFVIRGPLLVGIMVVLFFLTVYLLADGFKKKSVVPFCEATHRWAQEIELVSSIPDDEELFLSKLLMGDTNILVQLQPLNEVNVNHYKLNLFVTGGQEKFYITVTRMSNSGEVERKSGEMTFDENELVKNLVIDRSTGVTLLTHKDDEPVDTTVRVVTDETEKKAVWKAIFLALAGIAMIGIAGLAIIKMDDVKDFLMSGGFFYLIAIFITGLVNLVRSFQEDKVIVSQEDRYEYDAIKRYLVESRETSIGYRIFYIFLMVSAVILFAMCMWRI